MTTETTLITDSYMAGHIYHDASYIDGCQFKEAKDKQKPAYRQETIKMTTIIMDIGTLS